MVGGGIGAILALSNVPAGWSHLSCDNRARNAENASVKPKPTRFNTLSRTDERRLALRRMWRMYCAGVVIGAGLMA
jgi:hypothetical protein